MKTKKKDLTFSRRSLLGTAGASLVVMSISSTGVITGGNGAWAATTKALTPETFATLVQMSRDMYPHDRLTDDYYAFAVSSFDEAAAGDAGQKALFEDGVTALNKAANDAHGMPYSDVGWEADRVAILRAMESSGFFQKVRGSLITGLYNNKQVWEKFAYEGESASKGGYLYRGFDDIDWLDQV